MTSTETDLNYCRKRPGRTPYLHHLLPDVQSAYHGGSQLCILNRILESEAVR